MTKHLFQIDIPKRGVSCTVGQEAFAPGMSYYSLITSEGPLLRTDYCEACWGQVNSHGKTYWKSKVPAKKTAPQLSLNREERALELLKETLAAQEHAEAFVLALYLVRKRLLAYRQQHEGANLYEVLATEEMLCVKNVALSQLQVEALQSRIAEKLKV